MSKDQLNTEEQEILEAYNAGRLKSLTDTSKKNKPEIHTENGVTVEEEKEILQSAEEAERGENVYGPYMSVDEMFAELNKPEV